MIVIQLLLVLLFSALGEDWENNVIKGEDHFYLGDIAPFWKRMLYLWISYSHMIPISLYLALDIIKLCQLELLQSDPQLKNLKDGKGALGRNSDLVEELG